MTWAFVFFACWVVQKRKNNKGGRQAVYIVIVPGPKIMEKSLVRDEVLNRLKTIKGHITGIERMIEEGKTCEEVLLQIAAVKSSIEKTGLLILEEHSVDCLFREIRDDKAREKIEGIISTIIKYMK